MDVPEAERAGLPGMSVGVAIPSRLAGLGVYMLPPTVTSGGVGVAAGRSKVLPPTTSCVLVLLVCNAMTVVEVPEPMVMVTPGARV